MTKETKKPAKKSIKIGDFMIYPKYGAILIDDRLMVDVMGEKTDVFSAQIEHHSLKIMIPVNKIETVSLREVASKDEINAALDTLAKKSNKSSRPWIQRARDFENKIKTGDLKDLVDVVRSTYSPDESYSYSERDVFRQVMAAFVSEVAVVFEVSLEEAEGMVLDRLSSAYPNKKKTAA